MSTVLLSNIKPEGKAAKEIVVVDSAGNRKTAKYVKVVDAAGTAKVVYDTQRDIVYGAISLTASVSYRSLYAGGGDAVTPAVSCSYSQPRTAVGHGGTRVAMPAITSGAKVEFVLGSRSGGKIVADTDFATTGRVKALASNEDWKPAVENITLKVTLNGQVATETFTVSQEPRLDRIKDKNGNYITDKQGRYQMHDDKYWRILDKNGNWVVTRNGDHPITRVK